MFSTPPSSPVSLAKLNVRFERVEQEAKHQRELRALQGREHMNQITDEITRRSLEHKIRKLMVIEEEA